MSRSSSESGRAGAGLSTMRRPRCAAQRAALMTASSGTSKPSRQTACAGGSSVATSASTMAPSRRALAPEATAIWFSPCSSTTIRARPVWVSSMTWQRVVSTPASLRPASALRPRSSPPTAPSIVTCAPTRAAATAWLALLPPFCWMKRLPSTVSPGPGSSVTPTIRSTLMEPATTTAGLVSLMPLSIVNLAYGSASRRNRLRNRLREPILGAMTVSTPVSPRTIRGQP